MSVAEELRSLPGYGEALAALRDVRAPAGLLQKILRTRKERVVRVYPTALAAARAHAGRRGVNRVKSWNRYVDRLINSGIIEPAPPEECERKGWDHGWIRRNGRVRQEEFAT